MNDNFDEIRLVKLDATIDDAVELSIIAKRAYCDHYLHLWHDGGEWYLNKCFTSEILLNEIMDKNALFYLLKVDNENIGFIKLNIDAAIENYTKKQAIELERIYLVKTAVNRGYGKFVMWFIIDLARKYGKEIIWLKAMDSSQAAIVYYQKMGLEICGQTQLEFQVMREEFRGMVVMKRAV